MTTIATANEYQTDNSICREDGVPRGDRSTRPGRSRERLTKAERVERAKASREWAANQSKEALVSLEDSLRQGKSEALLQYLDVLSRFHKYSLRNLMLIALQRPSATQVAGFSTWKKLGRHVRKGEKGIRILAPVKYGKPQEDHSAVDQPTDEETRKVLAGFKCVSVFDISQTDGKELPEFSRATGDPGFYLERLKQAVEARGIVLEIITIPGGALGLSKGGKIEIAAGQLPAEEFATIAHEFAHELMHRDPDRQDRSHSVRETEAEAVAYVVCRAVGIEAKSQSTDYIHLHQGCSELLAASLGRIQEAAASIVESITTMPSTSPGF